jgi:metallophosphoesterase superfamily enzyme
MQNFRAFVIGVQDRNYEVEVVHGNHDPQVVQRNDVG